MTSSRRQACWISALAEESISSDLLGMVLGSETPVGVVSALLVTRGPVSSGDAATLRLAECGIGWPRWILQVKYFRFGGVSSVTLLRVSNVAVQL